jgi:tetratricopeptide (TPR) repeat protein
MRKLLLSVLLLAPVPALAKKPAPPPPPSWRCEAGGAEDYATAFAALGADKLDEAGPAFVAALAKEPQCGLALVGQGRVLLATGKAADAVVPLASAAALFPDKLDAQLWLGRARLATGDDAGALTAAKAALVVKPGSVDAQKVAQEALLHQRDYAGAHLLLADARKAANVTAFNCLEGLVFAAEGDTAKTAEMLGLCQGVPDPALYDALAAKVVPAAQTAAPAKP